MTIDVEGVVDGGVRGKKFLGRTRALEPLRSYGSAARDLGLECRRERGRWKNIRAENSHQPTRRRERKAKQACCAEIDAQTSEDMRLRAGAIGHGRLALRLDKDIEDLAFGVNCAPDIDHPATDFQIDLVQMPSRMRLRATLAQVGCDDGSEMVHPPPDGLVRDHNPAFGEQVFDVTEAEREPQVEPNRLLNDLRREPVARVGDFRHTQRLPRIRSPDKQSVRDIAFVSPNPTSQEKFDGKGPPRQSFATVGEHHAHHFTIVVRRVAAAVSLLKLRQRHPPYLFILDDAPMQRKLGFYELVV